MEEEWELRMELFFKEVRDWIGLFVAEKLYLVERNDNSLAVYFEAVKKASEICDFLHLIVVYAIGVAVWQPEAIFWSEGSEEDLLEISDADCMIMLVQSKKGYSTVLMV